MRLISGDECGLLKECIPERSSNPHNKPRRDDDDDETTPVAPRNAMQHVSLDGVNRIDPKETQARRRSIIDLTFVNDEELSFAALRQNGSIQMWEGGADSMKSFGKYRKTFETANIFEDTNSHPANDAWKPLALGCFSKESRLCAGDSLGNLRILNLKNGSIVETFSAYSSSKQGNTISYTPGSNINKQLATAMACDQVNGRVAVGGRERETTILDLASGKVVFKTKNLPPNPQTLLQHPVWPTSILFLKDSNTMAVGTAYKELRLYDVRESSKTRRPIARTTTEGGPIEYRVTALCQVQDHELAVGDAAGYIYSIDMRTLGKSGVSKQNTNNMGRYVGPAGSVRQLKKHPVLPRMAAVGLDRMLRVYDVTSRKQLDCFYMKQRLNCVLFGRDTDWRPGSTFAENADDDDQDIDQDDVVQDYVVSDEDDEESDTSGQEEFGDEDNQSLSEKSDSIQQDDLEHSSDDSSEASKDELEDESEDESTNEGGVDLSEEITRNSPSNSGDDDDGDDGVEEEIVIKAPKRRRKK